VKPALRRPFGVSTNTRRRRCGIRLTTVNGRVNGRSRPPARNKSSEWEPAPGGLARPTFLHVGTPDYFSNNLLELLHRENPLRAGLSAFGPKQTSLVAPHMSALGGKADMLCCGGHVRERAKADIRSYLTRPARIATMPSLEPWSGDEAACHARATSRKSGHRISQ
jgi:hypothetical protein